jgi:hypothetical protein
VKDVIHDFEYFSIPLNKNLLNNHQEFEKLKSIQKLEILIVGIVLFLINFN